MEWLAATKFLDKGHIRVTWDLKSQVHKRKFQSQHFEQWQIIKNDMINELTLYLIMNNPKPQLFPLITDKALKG